MKEWSAIIFLTAFIFTPPSASAQVTYSDFNGDGYEDAAIGSPKKAVGGLSAAGVVHVIYGSAAGLIPSTGVELSQNSPNVPGSSEAGDNFGAALASGDFDLDGFDDLIVGVPGEDFSDGINDTDAGAVIFLPGSQAGISGIGSRLISQGDNGVVGVRADNKRFGSALVAGFFDSDFRADLAVGVPGDDGVLTTDEGAVVMIHGISSSNAFTDSYQTRGFQAFEFYGASLASGDINNDGFDDVIVGRPGSKEDGFDKAGAISTRVSDGSRAWLFNDLTNPFPATNDQYGTAIGVGDFNNDGFDDVAVGRPGRDLPGAVDAGTVDVLIGAGSSFLTGAMLNVSVQQLGGVAPTAGGRFGSSLAVADFDGDAFADLAVGSPGHDVGTADRAGAVAVSYGRAQLPSVLHRPQLWHQNSRVQIGSRGSVALFGDIADNSESLDEFGSTLSAGDFNSDGFADLLVGVPGEDSAVGAVNVLYARNTGAGLSVQQNIILKPGENGLPGQRLLGSRFGASAVRSSLFSPSTPGFIGAFDDIKPKCVWGKCRLRGTLRVTNPGLAPASTTVVDLYLSTDNVLDPSDKLVLEGLPLSAIDSGAETTLPFEFTISRTKLVRRHLIAVLDADDQVAEADETNNTTASFKLTGRFLVTGEIKAAGKYR